MKGLHVVIRTPRIDTYYKGEPIIVFPSKKLCDMQELQAGPRSRRLRSIVRKIQNKWKDWKTNEIIGPEYLYDGRKPAEGLKVYFNPKKIVTWLEGDDVLQLIGVLHKINTVWCIYSDNKQNQNVKNENVLV